MRTRTRSVNETYPASAHEYHRYSVPPVTTPILFNYGARTILGLNETMTDEMPMLKRSGTCNHVKTVMRIYPCEYQYQYPHSGIYKVQPPSWPVYTHVYKGTSMFEQFIGNAYNNANFSPSIAVPSTFDWQAFSFAAVQQMRPSLNKEGLLLNNFIAESVAGSKAAAARWSNHKSPFGPKRPPLKGWAGRLMGGLRAASGFNLLWQFTIRPTLSDVKSILARLHDLDAMIHNLIEEGDKIQTRHYKCPIPDRITLPADYVYQDVALTTDYPGWKTYVETRWKSRPTYHATMRFRYDTSKLKGLLGSFRAKLGSYGISDVLPTIWEAIPYSFVVDWFVNVGSMLESIENAIVGDLLPIQILDFAHSVKYQYTTRALHDIGKGNWKFASGFLLFEREYTYYARRSEAPCLYDKLSVRTPSLNQLLLGGSLYFVRK